MPTGSSVHSPTRHLGRVGAIAAKAARHPAMQWSGYRKHSQSLHPSSFSVQTVSFRFFSFHPTLSFTNGSVDGHGSSGNRASSSENVQRGPNGVRGVDVFDRRVRRHSIRVSSLSLSFHFLLRYYFLPFPISWCSWSRPDLAGLGLVCVG